ncbi:phage recombination protein Bet [Microbacterium resistens]|uniref:Phage recombination protein Bet n=1 Tax=Microbacterium resistens TaxID=156977 RepID=A0ABY3RU83_9MICO|nr:phage recombination protein Bet [Microbacterium resistens]UGS27609.1 phage recombination protein Bet [Microbacterium resistens]
MSVAVMERPKPIALPTTADPSQWSDDEKALLDAAGLVKRPKNGPPEPAPRSTVVAFLAHCQRTGLDPIAKQIYAIERGGKWTITVSIDGFRLVAQRSGQYAGQTPVEWTGDGKTWVDVWLDQKPPAAARVGVRRRGFEEPLFAVARWSSYAVMVPKWENRQRVGEELSPMWQRMPDLMLGKVAEALALRRAFPMELSGLYTEEELDYELHDEPAPQGPRATAPTLEAGTRSAQRDPLPAGEPKDASGPNGAEATGSASDEPTGPGSGTPAVAEDPLSLTPEEMAEYGIEGGDQP